MQRATEAKLTKTLRDLKRVIVAYSGGVDSALLAVAAVRALGPANVLAVTADSPSLAIGELDHCRSLALAFDVPWLAVKTTEFDDERYARNNGDRCYWCKSALMDAVDPVAAERQATVTLGVNLDDLADHRPGQAAAKERGARFPLVEAGLDKSAIRTLAKQWDVPVWDRPSSPCLSSRVPYGTAVTVQLISQVDRAEAAIRRMGFDDVRVRHYDSVARIEVPKPDLPRAIEMADAMVAELTAVGYTSVTLDLAGLRSGNLNHALTQ